MNRYSSLTHLSILVYKTKVQPARSNSKEVAMPLSVEIKKKKEGVYSVQLTGRLDSNTYTECEAKLKPLLTDAIKSFELDLKRLDYISSAGLRVLINIHKAMIKNKAQFRIANPQPAVKDVLDLADIFPKTDSFQSRQSADIFLDAVQRREKAKGFDVDA